jgi:hypothetical protein
MTLCISFSGSNPSLPSDLRIRFAHSGAMEDTFATMDTVESATIDQAIRSNDAQIRR